MTFSAQLNSNSTTLATPTEPFCRAMITGIGCVNPFGVGGHTFVADVVANNATAIRLIASFPTVKLSRHLGAEIPPVYSPFTEDTRCWIRINLITVIACREALADAALHDTEVTHRASLVLGTEYGDLCSTESGWRW